jgi:phospholipid/cholesterol/gamma-HCH transport system substrate-binding protein
VTKRIRGTAIRFTVFVTACVFGFVVIFAIFGQYRFEGGATTYRAVFKDVSGLRTGNFVRIAGVEVGKVQELTYQPDTTVLVEFRANSTEPLTQGTEVLIRYDNLVGDRYLELKEGPGPLARLQPGATIPVTNTAPALDLDALLGGFKPLFQALNPEQVNALTGQLIQALQGQGTAIGSFLAQTAVLTSTLADRDELIGNVIDNLNTVVGTFADQDQQVRTAVDSLSQIVGALAAHKPAVTNALAYGNAAAVSIADLLSQARPPLQNTVHQTDRTSAIVVADHDYVDDLLNTLPDAYRLLARQGIYGDYFSFYICDVLLKLNGKGGQPVYVKVAGQSSGRCTPK